MDNNAPTYEQGCVTVLLRMASMRTNFARLLEQWPGEEQRDERDERDERCVNSLTRFDDRHHKLRTMSVSGLSPHTASFKSDVVSRDDRIKLLKLQITFLLHKKGHDGDLVSEEEVTAQDRS